MLNTVENAAAWLGCSEEDPFLESLLTVASSLCESWCGTTWEEDAIPAPVAQAALEVTAYLWRNRESNSAAIASESLGGASISYRDSASLQPITPTARVLLAPYVELALGSPC